jgi:hypothetical protein
MRRLLLLCITLSVFSPLFCQQIIQSAPVGWRGSSLELHTLHDLSGNQHASFLVNDDSIRIFLLDARDSLVKTFTVLRLNEEEFRGGFISGNKIFYFCGYRFPRGSHNYVLDTNDGTVSQNLEVIEEGKDKVIDRISAGDCFMIFSINKKTSEFIVSKWTSIDSEEVTRYPIRDENIWDEFTTAYGFTRNIKITKVDEAGLPDAAVVGSQRKLYLMHDSLLLILNKNRGTTEVFSFDTKRKIVSVRTIKNEEIQIVEESRGLEKKSGTEYVSAYGGYTDNSYLLDGKLFFISATPDRLHISIHDFYSGQVLKKYSVDREDTITFKNTAVIQEGQIYFFPSTKELTKTKQLLRKMLNGNAVIAALTDSLGLALTIGSNKEMQQMGSGGGSMAMPGAGGAPGGVVYVPTGGYSRSTWTKSVRFRMLLDSNSLDHVTGDMEPSINDRIDDYTKDIKIPPSGENLFYRNYQYVYIYYDKKQRSLCFTRFNY